MPSFYRYSNFWANVDPRGGALVTLAASFKHQTPLIFRNKDLPNVPLNTFPNGILMHITVQWLNAWQLQNPGFGHDFEIFSVSNGYSKMAPRCEWVCESVCMVPCEELASHPGCISGSYLAFSEQYPDPPLKRFAQLWSFILYSRYFAAYVDTWCCEINISLRMIMTFEYVLNLDSEKVKVCCDDFCYVPGENGWVTPEQLLQITLHINIAHKLTIRNKLIALRKRS